MNRLLEYYQIFMSYSRINPMMATAVGVWFGAIVTWALRDVPRRCWYFVVGQCTTSLEFHNRSEWGSSPHFYTFMEWFMKQPMAKFSRHISLDDLTNNSGITSKPNDSSSYLLGMGYGRHYFFYHWRLFWVAKTRMEGSNTSVEKQSISITGLTRSRKLVAKLAEEFAYKLPKGKLYHRIWHDRNWEYSRGIDGRDLDTILLNSEMKDEIVGHLEHFYNNKEWYTSKGLKYRKTFILHGKPGTGKTSLISALAARFNKTVYSLNMAEMSDSSFARAVGTVEPGSFLLLEDFDSADSLHSRTKKIKKGEVDQNAEAPSDMIQFNMSTQTLSGFLNTLDGISSLNDVIIFMTTNHLELIDDAVLRKGRVNHTYEIPYLHDAELRKGIQLYFPDADLSTIPYLDPMPGCNLEGFFLDAHGDFDLFVDRLLNNDVDYEAEAKELVRQRAALRLTMKKANEPAGPVVSDGDTVRRLNSIVSSAPMDHVVGVRD